VKTNRWNEEKGLYETVVVDGEGCPSETAPPISSADECLIVAGDQDPGEDGDAVTLCD